jgi:ABC-type nitrate/sulfonate/bicarbonate transport system substrate-binding protein
MINYKKCIQLSLVIVSLATVHACKNPINNDSNPPTPTSSSNSSTTIRVGYLPVLAGFPMYTAISEGYFKEAGLDVQMRTIKSGPEGNEALAANNIDVAYSILPSLVVANNKQVPNDLVSIFGASLDSGKIKDHRIIISKKSTLTSIKDLRGKKIAVVGYPGRTSDVLELLDHLKRNGLGEKDVQLIGMPHAEQVAALETGTIDAAACAEPYITLGLQSSVKTLGANEGFYYRDEPTEVTSYLARSSWLKANPEVAKKFIMALNKGLEKSKDKEWLINKGLPSFNKEQNPSITFVKLTADQSKKLHLPEVLPAATEGGLKYVSGQLLRHGPIKEAPKDFSVMLQSPEKVPVAK